MTPRRNEPCPCGSGKKYKRCHGLLSTAAEPAPDSLPPASLRAAERQLETANPRRAEALYRHALERSPRNAEVLADLGALLFQEGRLREAEDVFLAQTQVASGLASAHCNLGVSLLVQGRADEALALQRALELEARSTAALANRGAALKHLDRFDEAERSIRAARASRPTPPAGSTQRRSITSGSAR